MWDLWNISFTCVVDYFSFVRGSFRFLGSAENNVLLACQLIVRLFLLFAKCHTFCEHFGNNSVTCMPAHVWKKSQWFTIVWCFWDFLKRQVFVFIPFSIFAAFCILCGTPLRFFWCPFWSSGVSLGSSGLSSGALWSLLCVFGFFFWYPFVIILVTLCVF